MISQNDPSTYTYDEPNRTLVPYDDDFIASLRRRLAEYIKRIGVELTKRGNRLVGKCPVHDDSKPSFALFGTHHEAAGCYPCGFTGDVLAVSQWLG